MIVVAVLVVVKSSSSKGVVAVVAVADVIYGTRSAPHTLPHFVRQCVLCVFVFLSEMIAYRYREIY